MTVLSLIYWFNYFSKYLRTTTIHQVWLSTGNLKINKSFLTSGAQ